MIDVSFISLRLILPAVSGLIEPWADVIALVKPQFEAGKSEVGKGGIVRDAKVHRRVLQETVAIAHSLRFTALECDSLSHHRRQGQRGISFMAETWEKGREQANHSMKRLPP